MVDCIIIIVQPKVSITSAIEYYSYFPLRYRVYIWPNYK